MSDLAHSGLLARRKPIGLVCAFCGKSQSEVRLMVAGPRVAICDECSDQVHEIISARREADRAIREGGTDAVP